MNISKKQKTKAVQNNKSIKISFKLGKYISIENVNLLGSDYLKRIKIKNKDLDFWSKNEICCEEKNIIGTYNLVKEIKDYAKNLQINVELDSKIQDRVESIEREKEEEKINVDIALKIKAFANQKKKDFKNSSFVNFLEREIKTLKDFFCKKYQKITKTISSVIEEKFNKQFQLYDKQEMSIYHHVFLNSACNFSVPGSGKTLIALIVFFILKKLEKCKKLFLIAPLNACFSWKNEYEKFFKKCSYKHFLQVKEKIDSTYAWTEENKEIIFINYEKLSNNEEKIVDFLEENDVFLVLDEVHKVRNDESKRTQTTKKILKKCKQKLLLTGTPMPKDYKDLKTYFEFMPTNEIKFIQDKSINKWKTSENQYKSKIKEMKNEIKPFYLRIKKKDLKLVKCSFEYWNEFKNDDKQQKIYKIIEDKLVMELKNYKDRKKLMEILKAKILRLMQASVDPRMIKAINEKTNEDNNEYDNENEESEERENYIILEKNKEDISEGELIYDKERVPNRYQYCFKKVESLFEEEKVKKIIIWSCWVYAIKELYKIFKNKYNTEVIYGPTIIEDRIRYYKDFQDKNGKIQVIICNPATVSESISLHQFCHDAVYFDMTWNALYFMQSKDRIHRYTGNKGHKVNYYIIKNEDSIDKVVWESINNKEERMNTTLESDEANLEVKNTDHLFDDIIKNFDKKKKIN